ncbi:MAG: hypothetical protein CVU42_08205 [Chloroflexi bacterium HGW-Chloroflexi-4]|jgi:hypothetical protein|nr:MAG: hypothetical protein CVU45_05140 [Chloroflexi bacterium HGW-Chloroflexi-7]PKN99469.1 MAG: hypothetical protein CVU42_08205 [Chloroflexi bacterium HGW-Chloroflexi-4]
MVSKVSLIFTFIILGALAGCQKAENMKNISQISIISESGTILPELQWHEEFILQPDSIIFKRSGNTDASNINNGSWQVPFEPAALSALFQTLEQIDLSKINRIEPLDQPDGGGSQYFTFTFSADRSWSLDFNPGVTYTHGEWITQPLQDFINKLQLPAEAANRYK